jgi:hypothetical protein
MSYATPTNVKSMFRNFASGSSPAVTDAEIQEFLDDASNIIDSKIGTTYQLPITIGDNPASFSILKRIEIFMVAAIVDDILNSYGEADKKPIWGKKAEDLLNEYVPKYDKSKCIQCDPTSRLPDAVYLGTSTQRGRIKLNPTSGTTFTKGGNNW